MRSRDSEIEKIEEELKELKEERKRIGRKREEGQESVRKMKMIKNKIEKKRKKKRKIILKEKINELEICYQARDTKRYWDKLKEVGGWKRRGGGRIPDTAIDERRKRIFWAGGVEGLERFLLPVGSRGSR